MIQNVFLDKQTVPDMEMLSDSIKDSCRILDSILQFIKSDIGEVIIDWKHYGKNIGWTMKCLLKKRNLFFLTAGDGCFHLSFVFGEKAVAVIERSDLPQEMIEVLVNARKYAEGRGLGIEVHSDEHLENIKQLIKIKVKN